MKYIFALAALVLAVLVSGCTGTSTTGTLAVSMKDAPLEKLGDVSAIELTVASIQIHVSGNTQTTNETNSTNETTTEAGWITIFEGMKKINLLDYVENSSLLFGEKQLEVGNYQQIRLYVDEATITVDGETHEITIPSSVIKVVRGFEVEANETTLLVIDWDVEESILQTGKGAYRLKPTIKIDVENNVDLAERQDVKRE